MPKYLLNSNDLIQHMKSKGIKFNIINEVDATEFIKNHNYYFKLAAYRKNYDQIHQIDGSIKYASLEFAYLQELSVIDCHMRYLILELCLDVEHALKLLLINDVESNPLEDGYNLINQWDVSYYIRSGIYNKMGKSYSSDLVKKYHPNYPLYAFLELISFGDLCRLINKYDDMYPKRLKFDTNLLYSVKNLRNACAHNSCLINNLRVKSSNKPNQTLMKELRSYGIVSNASLNKKLCCQEIHDFMCLLLVYPHVVFSQRQKEKALDKISDLVEKRMRKNRKYFVTNNVIESFYIFLLKSCRALCEKLY